MSPDARGDTAPEAAKSGGATPCPACSGRLYPRLLKCTDCGLEVTTRYAENEFADLDAELLHLLRIFVLCEGRIRDMEAALGVSYPTVKARLAALRTRLGLTGESAKPPPASQAAKPPTEPQSVAAVLDALEAGALDYETAKLKIRALKGKR